MIWVIIRKKAFRQIEIKIHTGLGCMLNINIQNSILNTSFK